MKELRLVKIILRIGIFGTFLGHGVLALTVHPQWIPFLTVFGISVDDAMALMPLIGLLDLVVASTILFYPLKIVLFWAVFWTFLTALMRPVSGSDIWPFIERFSFWAAPMALLLLNGLPKKLSDLFTI
ncbi:MAG: hypothetical protein GXO88_10580 [Chlorobi bacterium]|nr:hypothetical protein [Chlorobiota bacterium]